MMIKFMRFMATELRCDSVFRILIVILLLANISFNFYVFSYIDERLLDLQMAIWRGNIK
jgi:hypothetical protein